MSHPDLIPDLPWGQLMRLASFLSLGAALTSTSLSLAARVTVFSLEEKQGPNGIGLKVVEQYDYSRSFQPLIDEMGKPYQGERARPLQTLIWYPAQASNGTRITLGDYIAFQATETSFGKPQMLTGSLKQIIASMKPILWNTYVGGTQCSAGAWKVSRHHLRAKFLIGAVGKRRLV